MKHVSQLLSVFGLMLFAMNASAADEPRSLRLSQSIKFSDGEIRSVAFSPDNKLLAACGDRFVHVVEAKTGKRLYRFEGHTGDVLSAAFSPKGRWIASCSVDTTVRLWPLDSALKPRVLRVKEGFKDPIRRVLFSPDGKSLVTCSPSPIGQNQVQLVDVETGLWTYRARVIDPREPLSLAVSPNGSMIAVGEKPGIVALWDIAGFGIRTHFIEDRQRNGLADFRMHHDDQKPVVSVDFSSDSQRILSSGLDNTVRVWDANSGGPLMKISAFDDEGMLQAALFSPDGARIVSVTRNETIRIWDAGNGKPLGIVKGSEKKTNGLALSPDGKLAATCSGEGVVNVWSFVASQ